MKKINFKKVLSWFNGIDKAIWKEDIDVSPWFATCILSFSAIVGAYAGGANFLNEMFDADFRIPAWLQNIEWMLLLWGLLLGESLTCGNTIKTMVTRSLFMIPAVVLMFLAGNVLSVLVLGLVTLVVALYVMILIIKLFLGVAVGDTSSSTNGKRRWKTENGETLTESGSGLLGERYAKDSHGNEYKVEGDSATKI